MRREMDREYNDRDKDKDKERRYQGKERERGTEMDQDREKSRERDKVNRKHRNESHDKSRDARKDDNNVQLEVEDAQNRDMTKRGKGSHNDEDVIKHEPKADVESGGSHPSKLELEERNSKMKEDNGKKGAPAGEDEEEVVPDEAIHEVAIGKGLLGTLKLLKDRGILKETVEWGGRNMDKKKSKLVGIYQNDGSKEIRIEKTDEYGQILPPKEAFRLISHKFHGKKPGKGKQKKRMRKYEDGLKVKQMKYADTPSLSVERMIETQARLKTPYLVLSGNVKLGYML